MKKKERKERRERKKKGEGEKKKRLKKATIAGIEPATSHSAAHRHYHLAPPD